MSIHIVYYGLPKLWSCAILYFYLKILEIELPWVALKNPIFHENLITAVKEQNDGKKELLRE